MSTGSFTDTPRPEMQDLFRVVKDLCKKEIAPRAAEIDACDEWPRDIWQRFVDLGLLGLRVPEDLGGGAAHVTETSAIFEEVAKASAACSLILASTVEWLLPIVAFAHPELRKETVARVMEKGEVACLGITEPSGGSDATAMKTYAELGPRGWVINGQKAWCSFGAVGAMYLIIAVTDPQERKSRRLTAFLIDRETDGLIIERAENKLGLHGLPLNGLTLQDVVVPEDRMVGTRGQGLAVAMHLLNESRVGVAAQCVGMSSYCLDQSTVYASGRRAFGSAIGDLQAVQLMLADMAIRTEAARALTARAASAYDSGSQDALMLAAAAKAAASDGAVASALDAIQIHGANGFTQDYGVERVLRDAKGYQIFEGANQIMRLTIAKSLFGRLSPAS